MTIFCCSCYSVAYKLAHYLGDVLEDQKDKLAENLTANGGKNVMVVPRYFL